MANTRNVLRSRPIGMGHLRAFEAVARHLNFRVASEELALTQSAVSRQIQALEQEIGVPLFLRHTRAVELTAAGAELLSTVNQVLPRLDASVQRIRHSAGRQSVSVTTFASMASMWLIPRLEAFQQANPEVDIRLDASDHLLDLEVSEIDVALRYGPPSHVPPHAEVLFGEQITPVLTPWLAERTPIRHPRDLAQFTLIDVSDAHRFYYGWQRWSEAVGMPPVQPKRWLAFNLSFQMMQAARAGQGVALARVPLIDLSLASGELVEALPGHRVSSPRTYWLMVSPRSAHRPEVKAFAEWLREQATQTAAVLAAGQVFGALPGKSA